MNPVLKRVLTGLAVGSAVICAILFAPVQAIRPACVALAVLATVEIAMLALRRRKEAPVKAAAAAVFFTALTFLAFLTLPRVAAAFGNATLLYLVAIVKFSDVGGFAFGLASARMMAGGNHKLCPSVSPNKSWEGLLGSVVVSCLVSCAFAGVTRFGVATSVALGVTAACVGTMGDLVESLFKRWVGVKDSSTLRITNGMGGFLDMFDSLLLAVPVLAVLMERIR